MKKHIIFVDLDGTLLESIDTAHQDTVEYLKELKEHAHVVINTGRPYRSSKQFYEQLGLDTPISNYNGAYVHNPSNPHFQERMLTLDKDEFFQILRDKDEVIEGAFAEIRDEVFTHKNIEKYEKFLNTDQVVRDNIFENLKTSPNSIVIIAKDGKTDEIMEYIEKNTSFKSRNWGKEYKYIIELFIDDVSKGSSCKYIVEQLGLPHEYTIGFGDEQNDISMFQYVNVSVAMGNAHDDRIGDHPKFQTLRNTEGGIRAFLEDYFAGKDLSKYYKNIK